MEAMSDQTKRIEQAIQTLAAQMNLEPMLQLNDTLIADVSKLATNLTEAVDTIVRMMENLEQRVNRLEEE
jgi:Skp family chaperone for outer membrane proteins